MKGPVQPLKSEWEVTLWKKQSEEPGCEGENRGEVPREIQVYVVLLPCVKHGRHLNMLTDIGEGDGWEPVSTGER